MGNGKRRNFEGASIPLENRHKIFIIKRRAEFCEYAEIYEAFREAFAADIEAAGGIFDDQLFNEWLKDKIAWYTTETPNEKWKTLFVEYREAWRNHIADDIYLANKRARVQELAKEYGKIPDDYLWKEFLSGASSRKMNTEAKVRVLDQIRREMEGDRIPAEWLRLLSETDEHLRETWQTEQESGD